MTNPQCDAARWADYSGALRAVLDEYARAIHDLERVMRSTSQAQYEARTDLSDETYPDMRAVSQHVACSAHSYVDYIEDAVDGVDRGRRERQVEFGTPAAMMKSTWDGFERMVVALGRVKHFTDDDMEKIGFDTRWGERFNMAQMLEHAIVHILRHRRQFERWLVATARAD